MKNKLENMEKQTTMAEIVRNIRECEEHSHQPQETGTVCKCPWCGYQSSIWAVDNFGWPECPNCGAT